MALSGFRAHCTGSWCLALLVLLGDLAMEERNKLLFGKHLLPGEKLVHKPMAFHSLQEETCLKAP